MATTPYHVRTMLTMQTAVLLRPQLASRQLNTRKLPIDIQFCVKMQSMSSDNGVDWMICECSDGARIHEEYQDPDVHWSQWGVPEGLTCYYICMTCSKSWLERFYWGRDAVMAQEEQT